MVAKHRVTVWLEPELVEQARRLGVDISSAAREGVVVAIRHAMTLADIAAYQQSPEAIDEFWTAAEVWTGTHRPS